MSARGRMRVALLLEPMAVPVHVLVLEYWEQLLWYHGTHVYTCTRVHVYHGTWYVVLR